MADARECSILILLDLSESFDTVDHAILIDRLKHWVCIRDTVLCWLSFYLSHRNISVTVSNSSSSSADITWGVPQGSILGPILFSLYMLPLGRNIRKHNVFFNPSTLFIAACKAQWSLKKK